jgi:protein MYSM1
LPPSSGRKRAIGGANGGGYFTANYEDESLHMLRCDPYADLHPGSGLPGAQPFRVTVDPLVLAVVDFHAHMLSSEIIGFLGGHWNSAQVR